MERLTLRKVNEKDLELLFRWTNDPVTRAQSFHMEPVTWEEHCAWFARKQQDAGCRQYICELGSEPAGTLRLDRQQEDRYLISYSIAPEYRGRGIGKQLLSMVEQQICADIPDCRCLVGEVKRGNTVSVRCFEENGYRIASEDTKTEELSFSKKVDRSKCLYIRADGNGHVGMGHVMRCLTIADACREKHLPVVFIMADDSAVQNVIHRGYPVKILHTPYDEPTSETGILQKWLPEQAHLLLDGYLFNDDYISALKSYGCRIAWMDDLGEHAYPVDQLINYNIYAKNLPYEELYRTVPAFGLTGVRHKPEFLLGTDYAPIRPVYYQREYQVNDKITSVMITTGATDPTGAGPAIAKLLLRLLPEAEIRIVSGIYNSSRDRLYELSGSCSRLRVLEKLPDLSEVMYDSDLAIAATGSTIYELCAVGVPVIPYYFADNQKPGAVAFAQLTHARNAGCFPSEDTLTAISEAVLELQSREAREKLSGRLRQVVDGKGASRIADRLADI